MAKELYVGIDGLAKKVSNMYVGVEGVARKVTKGYVGVNGVARLFYETGLAGQIIIKTANTTNWVEVGGVKYTSPTTVPFKEETYVTMYLNSRKTSSGYNAQWTANSFTLNNSTTEEYVYIHELDFDTLGLSYENLNFVALPGYTYYIDAVNYDVVIERPNDDQWDGVIFTSSKKAYPCVSMLSEDGECGNLFLSNSTYYWLQAISDKYTNNMVYGPIDVTNFKTLYFESSGKEYLPVTCNPQVLSGSYSTSQRRGHYKLYVGTSSGSSNIASVTKYVKDGAVTTVDLSKVTGNIYIYVHNIYSNQSVAIKEMKLLK